MPKLDSLIAQTRHFEFFWYPHTDVACREGNRYDDRRCACIRSPKKVRAARGATRCCRTIGRTLHTEMEYSVPAEDGPACMHEIRALIRKQFPDLKWPVEYRTLAADDVWLSTAYERPTVTISVHQDVNEDDEPYFRACEEIFDAYAGGRIGAR